MVGKRDQKHKANIKGLKNISNKGDLSNFILCKTDYSFFSSIHRDHICDCILYHKKSQKLEIVQITHSNHNPRKLEFSLKRGIEGKKSKTWNNCS